MNIDRITFIIGNSQFTHVTQSQSLAIGYFRIRTFAAFVSHTHFRQRSFTVFKLNETRVPRICGINLIRIDQVFQKLALADNVISIRKRRTCRNRRLNINGLIIFAHGVSLSNKRLCLLLSRLHCCVNQSLVERPFDQFERPVIALDQGHLTPC